MYAGFTTTQYVYGRYLLVSVSVDSVDSHLLYLQPAVIVLAS